MATSIQDAQDLQADGSLRGVPQLSPVPKPAPETHEEIQDHCEDTAQLRGEDGGGEAQEGLPTVLQAPLGEVHREGAAPEGEGRPRYLPLNPNGFLE